MKKTYTLRVKCSNCDEVRTEEFPCGTKTSALNVRCSNCGCSGVLYPYEPINNKDKQL